MRLLIRPGARCEIFDARDWYEARSQGLGSEFVRAVDSAIAQVRRMPLASPFVEGPFRQALIRKFPYSIIYRADELDQASARVLIVACFHHRRRPRSWKT